MSPSAELAEDTFARNLYLRGNQLERIERRHIADLFSPPTNKAGCREVLGITMEEYPFVIDGLRGCIGIDLSHLAIVAQFEA
jgi:hypothetical protein